MFDWFFTPNNTSSKVIAITIGTIKYCYNISEEWNLNAFEWNGSGNSIARRLNECNGWLQINQFNLISISIHLIQFGFICGNESNFINWLKWSLVDCCWFIRHLFSSHVWINGSIPFSCGCWNQKWNSLRQNILSFLNFPQLNWNGR